MQMASVAKPYEQFMDDKVIPGWENQKDCMNYVTPWDAS